MKNLFLIFVLILTIGCAYSAPTNAEIKEAKLKTAKSNNLQHKTCMNIANNFRNDHRMASYMKGKCVTYESDRQRLIENIFPLMANSSKEYKENYYINISKFVEEINNKEIETYKTIITEYCKYNAYRFAKTDKNTCSTDRINSFF